MKPDGSERWDLDRDRDFKEVLDMIVVEQPWLVTTSPPCKTFSPLRRLSNYKRDYKVVEQEETEGRLRLHRSMECCRAQADQGGYFLHEHPKEATSWEDEKVKAVKSMPGVYLVQSPMCRFNMKLKDMHGEELHVRKETLWMTNSKEIADQLQGVCENQLQGREVHRHVHLIGGGRSKMAASKLWMVYFCNVSCVDQSKHPFDSVRSCCVHYSLSLWAQI